MIRTIQVGSSYVKGTYYGKIFGKHAVEANGVMHYGQLVETHRNTDTDDDMSPVSERDYTC